MSEKKSPVALALSGGGIRAMAFHLGVLRCLAEHNLLEQVTHVSTVSGGSLILGLLLQETQFKWPNSTEYIDQTLPALKHKLCSKSLMLGMIRQLRHPRNWRFLFSRANLLAGALRKEWEIEGVLSNLPVSPELSINGTTAETGKRFRFKRVDIGDYILGYASSNEFPLAEALAVSAAFPGGIGPLAINAAVYDWKKRAWSETVEQAKSVHSPYSKLHLYDGGVYDNLGLEPFFDVGKRQVKDTLPENVAIVVSDAGSPLTQGFSYFALNPWRAMRVVDIMSDQSRSLRIRAFISYLQQRKENGKYLYIGDPVSSNSPCKSADFASRFPTTLRQLTEDEFEKIMEHGYQITCKAYS